VAAPSAGTVQSIEVAVGAEVAGGQLLVVIA
jgi:biotin carboxyl carrier protein